MTAGDLMDFAAVSLDLRTDELLRGRNFGHVATIRRDGSARSVPVWVDVREGRPVLNGEEGTGWPTDLKRDPRVTLTVQNAENPYEYAIIRGRVADRSRDGADEHIDQLTRRYWERAQYPFRQPGETRVIITIEPEHVSLLDNAPPAQGS